MQTVFLALALALTLFGPAMANDEGLLSRLVPDLSIGTTFAHDFGEQMSRVTYKGQDYTPDEATAKILPALNWPDREDKLELGTVWARVFGFQGCEVLTRDHYMYKEQYPEPVAEFLPDGTFRYSAWAVNLTGREPGGILFRVVEISPQAVLRVNPGP